jgi:hypothetical protein
MAHLRLFLVSWTGTTAVSRCLNWTLFPIAQLCRSKLASYSRSFFSMVSCDRLHSNQYVLLNLRLSCFLFVVICSFHVSLRSRCIPKYFTSFTWGNDTLSILTVGHVAFLTVEVICNDLVWFLYVNVILKFDCSNIWLIIYC